MTSKEQAQQIVEAYAKGLICSAEVVNQFVDHMSDGDVEIYMGTLSPELIVSFERALKRENDHPLAAPEDLKKWRHVEDLMRTWLHRRNPEAGGSPVGGPTEASA